MDHGPEHDASKNDEYQARKKCVTPGEPLACRRVEAINRTHAAPPKYGKNCGRRYD